MKFCTFEELEQACKPENARFCALHKAQYYIGGILKSNYLKGLVYRIRENDKTAYNSVDSAVVHIERALLHHVSALECAKRIKGKMRADIVQACTFARGE